MKLCHARKLRNLAGCTFLGAWILTGCGKEALDSDEASCLSDTDCGAEQLCQPIPSPSQREAIVPPCMIVFSYCSSSTGCSNGEVCWPQGRTSFPLPSNCYASGRLCGPPCSASDLCLADEVCEASGECRMPACDEANAIACPNYWRCDPAAAETEAVRPVMGANEADAPQYGRDVLRGCARIRCDQSGGFTCKEGWVCDPENATDPSGCSALPCATAGRCSDDARFICEPTSSAPRPTGRDVHGCVPKNCEEGLVCQRMLNGVNIGYCDFAGPLVDAMGCASLRCDEPGSVCSTNMICEPGSSLADARGCRPANTGTGGTSGSGGSSAGGRAGAGGAGQGGQGAVSGSSSAGTTSTGGGGGSGATGGSAGTSANAGTSSVEVTGRCVDR